MNAICEDQHDQHWQDYTGYMLSPWRGIDRGAIEMMNHCQDEDAG